MSLSITCHLCVKVMRLFGENKPVTPTHCFGTQDQKGTPGVIGSGVYCSCECRSWPHQPHELWNVAASEHPDDAEARRDRYRELMVDHGHIVKRQPGQSVNLPCGWPHRPEPPDVEPRDAAHDGASNDGENA